MKRTVIRIDEAFCNGCGNCIDGCHEGALQLIDGKAVMISDLYCDGLGACIGECPVGAIAFEEREAAPTMRRPSWSASPRKVKPFSSRTSGTCTNTMNTSGLRRDWIA